MRRMMCLLLMVLTTSFFSGSVLAEGMDIGVGYQGVFLGDVLQGLSGRAWFDEVGVEANLSQMKASVGDTDADLFLFGAKALYAPVVKENSKFYVGLEGQFGSVDFDGDDADITQFGPLFGAEYRFTELPEMGFCWEVGYRFLEADLDGYDLELDGISVALGLHYYFD